MDYNSDIVRLVIKNVSLVEGAQEVLYQIDDKFVEAIWEYIARYCREQGGFSVQRDRNGDQCLWDAAWPRKDDGLPLASFWLDGQGTGWEDKSWLANLCGLTQGASAGLYFWYQWNSAGLRRKDWKTRLRDFFSENPALRDAGFCLNETGTAIVKPLLFDLDCVADNFNELENCLEPLDYALKAIFANRDLFTKLILNAR